MADNANSALKKTTRKLQDGVNRKATSMREDAEFITPKVEGGPSELDQAKFQYREAQSMSAGAKASNAKNQASTRKKYNINPR